MFVLLAFFETRLANQLRLIRTFAFFCLVPELCAWLIARAFEVKVRIEGDALVIDQRKIRVEIPCDQIRRVIPWAVPAPEAGGVWLELKSGRRFRSALAFTAPLSFRAALAACVKEDDQKVAERASTHAFEIVGIGRRNTGRGSWDHPAFKFLVFSLVPAVPLFRLHQWITYGGTFGEYYIYGLKEYLLAFAIYWWTSAISLVLYAAVLRAIAEPIVFAISVLSPSGGLRARRNIEVTLRVFYYAGVALFLLRLFLLSLQ
jgi:apolipoprotein N-acyltransferase